MDTVHPVIESAAIRVQHILEVGSTLSPRNSVSRWCRTSRGVKILSFSNPLSHDQPCKGRSQHGACPLSLNQRPRLRHVPAGPARALPTSHPPLGPQQRGAHRFQPTHEPHPEEASRIIGRRGEQRGECKQHQVWEMKEEKSLEHVSDRLFPPYLSPPYMIYSRSMSFTQREAGGDNFQLYYRSCVDMLVSFALQHGPDIRQQGPFPPSVQQQNSRHSSEEEVHLVTSGEI